jgi:hypothetical protein
VGDPEGTKDFGLVALGPCRVPNESLEDLSLGEPKNNVDDTVATWTPFKLNKTYHR